MKLLGNGSAYYAPAASMVQMAEDILKDKKRILPSIAYLEGEYGYNDLYLGGSGIESIIEIHLTAEEQWALDQSVQSVQNIMSILVAAK